MILKNKLIAWVPALLMMVIIFRFSVSNGEQSSGLSLGLTQKVVDTIETITNTELTPQAETSFIEGIHTPIRKFGHFMEYAVLALTVAFPLYVYHKKRGWKLIRWSEGICVLYAATDEIHQLFVEGRSGQFRDVLIDGVGAAFGILCFFFILTAVNSRKKKQAQ